LIAHIHSYGMPMPRSKPTVITGRVRSISQEVNSIFKLQRSSLEYADAIQSATSAEHASAERDTHGAMSYTEGSATHCQQDQAE
jgi:hypothetical protein